MRSFSIVFVCALIVCSGIASAGTFIGNGGGIGELQARRAVEDLKDIAEYCQRHPQSCAHMEKATTALSCAQALYPNWVQIDFDKSEEALAYKWADGNRLIVSPGELYIENVPKTFEAISVFIYEAILGQAGDLAQQIYATFKRVATSLSTRVNWHEVVVQLMKSSEFSDHLTLQSGIEAYDLNAHFTKLPRCESARSARMHFDQLHWTAQGRSSVHLSGTISYSCGNTNMTGDFHMFLPFDEQGLLKENNVTVTFTYLH